MNQAVSLWRRRLMKCCVGILVPDGHVIPFCAYNSVGYREQIREQLALEQAGSNNESS